MHRACLPSISAVQQSCPSSPQVEEAVLDARICQMSGPCIQWLLVISRD